MPTTAGGLTFYEEQFETGVWLGLTQFISAFNAASANSIVLQGGARKGRKPVNTVADDISGLIQSRDPGSPTDTLTPSTFSNSEARSIKIFRSAPVLIRRQDWIDQGFDTQEGQRLWGQQFGAAQAQDYLNTIISALVGAITAIGATAILDVTGDTEKNLRFQTLNSGLGKMGDRRSAIRTLVSDSKPLTDLVGTAFDQQAIAFQVGGTTVTNGMVPHMGLRKVNTDSPSLFIDNTGTDHYRSLMLVQNAARVKTGPSSTVFSFVPGDASATPANQQWLLTIEYEFELEIKGVSYKSASADNPNDAALQLGTNWETYVSDRKLGPGVLLITE